MHSKIRYAVIGTGGIAQTHLKSITAKPEVEVVGLSDTAEASLQKTARDHPRAFVHEDAEVMLRETQPDLVSICTPNKFHCVNTLAALAVGAHVICEKPMAMTVREATQMEKARAKSGRLGLVNFSYRNCVSFRFAREMIAAGELGNLIRLNACYYQSWLGAPATKYSWRNDKSLAGFGALGDLGIHMIDSARFVTGQEIMRVVGTAQTLVKNKADAAGRSRRVTTDTNSAFLTEFQNGMIGTFETTQVAVGYGNYFRIEISGDKGTLAILSEDDRKIWLNAGRTLSTYGTWASSLPPVGIPTDFVGRQPPAVPGLIVDLIRGESHDHPTFKDGVIAQWVLDGILESAKTRHWVKV